MDVDRFYFQEGRRDMDFISLVAVGGDFCLPNLFNEQWSLESKDGNFFFWDLCSFLGFKDNFKQRKLYMEKKSRWQVFSLFLLWFNESFLYFLVLADNCVMMLAGLAMWWVTGHNLLCWVDFTSLPNSNKALVVGVWGVAFFFLLGSGGTCL